MSQESEAWAGGKATGAIGDYHHYTTVARAKMSDEEYNPVHEEALWSRVVDAHGGNEHAAADNYHSFLDSHDSDGYENREPYTR